MMFREMEDEDERAKRLVRVNNFTQQTNALDADKHMYAPLYLVTELLLNEYITGWRI